MTSTPTGRFAPSPTGYLHLGHALSALTAWHAARDLGGRFLLRVEDIDTQRCRPEYDAAILEDLHWLGLDWDGPVRRQSAHVADYRPALDRLLELGVLYPCFCSRKDIQAALDAKADRVIGPDGPHYPGTCRGLGQEEQQARLAANMPYALRLDASKAAALIGEQTWIDTGLGTQPVNPGILGDVVIARKDTPMSYHLAVVVDDGLQGVTHVVRGRDLLASTSVHRTLQVLLDLSAPVYTHHRLLLNDWGTRLAKRDNSTGLRDLRAQGVTAAEIRTRVGFADARPKSD